jgi:hypothetical protein
MVGLSVVDLCMVGISVVNWCIVGLLVVDWCMLGLSVVDWCMVGLSREELCKSLFELRIYIYLKLERSTAHPSIRHKLCVTTVHTSTADRPTTHPSW